jgi:hypothetical protein
MAGGEEALKKFSSTYTPDTRMPQGKKVSAAANGSLITADDIRQRYQQNVKSKIKK